MSNMERKIDLHLNRSELDPDIPTDQLYMAIGYLSQYAMHDEFIYDELSIMARDKGHEILACYFDTGTNRRFTMGAIYRPHKKKFSFHS